MTQWFIAEFICSNFSNLCWTSPSVFFVFSFYFLRSCTSAWTNSTEFFTSFKSFSIDHLRNRQNFDLNKSRQKFHLKMTENCKLRNAILSAFYNISQRNFGILLILWCSFKLWWNFCLDQNFSYKVKGPLEWNYKSLTLTSLATSCHKSVHKQSTSCVRKLLISFGDKFDIFHSISARCTCKSRYSGRVNVPTQELISFYVTCIRSVLDQASK
jgi:hypothetical protein